MHAAYLVVVVFMLLPYNAVSAHMTGSRKPLQCILQQLAMKQPAGPPNPPTFYHAQSQSQSHKYIIIATLKSIVFDLQ